MNMYASAPWKAFLRSPEHIPGEADGIWAAEQCAEHVNTARVSYFVKGARISYDLSLPMAFEEYERIRRRERWIPSTESDWWLVVNK